MLSQRPPERKKFSEETISRLEFKANTKLHILFIELMKKKYYYGERELVDWEDFKQIYNQTLKNKAF